MPHEEAAREPRRKRAAPRTAGEAVYAAVDLGTNNCRLLVAERAAGGFRVIESYSRIIRLGEGLAHTGRLSEAAMDRGIEALKECASLVAVQHGLRLSCVATQACRVAENGEAFIARVRRETGLAFRIVSPEEEARLSVRGCAALIDPGFDVALVVDIGGGSTELSWVEARTGVTLAWTSVPIGVVTLAETAPEPESRPERDAWYHGMKGVVEERLGEFSGAESLRPAFLGGQGHIVGTSGAVSSLAGVHLGLLRYQRARVDGLWMTGAQVASVAGRLRDMSRSERAGNACIGANRADLVVPGAAILEAVVAQWPATRVRVADRGLREGVLIELMEADERA